MSRKPEHTARKSTNHSPFSLLHSRVIAGCAATLLTVLILCHVTLFQRIAHVSSLSCQQQPPQNPDADALANLQHLKYQRLSLQSVLNSRMTGAGTQIAAAESETGRERGSLHSEQVLAASLTLFVGILSRSSDSRQLTRDGWLMKAASFPGWTARFITQASSSSGVHEEQQEHGDLLLTEDKSALHQTVFMMQYALVHFNVRFILKTEETSYVHIGNLLAVLHASCSDAECHHQGLYLGHEVRNSSLLASQHEQMLQVNQEYWKHTRLKTYMPYMSGIGYVLSADLAHAVLDSMQHASPDHWLLEFGNDDVSIGFWLMSLSVHRINHSGVFIAMDEHTQKESGHESSVSSSGELNINIDLHTNKQPDCTHLGLLGDFCKQDWLVMSPVRAANQVSCFHNRLHLCERLGKVHAAAIDVAVRHIKPSKLLLTHGKVFVLLAGHDLQHVRPQQAMHKLLCLLWGLQTVILPFSAKATLSKGFVMHFEHSYETVLQHACEGHLHHIFSMSNTRTQCTHTHRCLSGMLCHIACHHGCRFGACLMAISRINSCWDHILQVLGAIQAQ